MKINLSKINLGPDSIFYDLDGTIYQGSIISKFPDNMRFGARTGTNAVLMFSSCGRLTTVPLFDTSSVTNMNNMFNGCNKLTNLGGFKNLGVAINLSASILITEESMVNVFNNLATVTTSQTLTLGSTNLAKLTDEEKAIATGKGWTLA